MKNFIIAILVTTLLACERQDVVDIDVPQKSKLYCALFLGEGETDLIAYVSRSQPVLGSSASEFTEEIKLPDAIVTLTSDLGEEHFTYDPTTGYYNLSRSQAIRQNVLYTVMVKQGGDSTVGTCILPTPAQFDNVITIDSIYDAANDTYLIRANGELKLKSELTAGVTVLAHVIFEDSSDFFMYNAAKQRVALLNKGESLTYSFTQNTQVFGLRPIAVVIQAYTITEDLYKYQKHASSIDLSTFFPFAEPIFMYSNMSSGLGIIGAYTQSGIYIKPL